MHTRFIAIAATLAASSAVWAAPVLADTYPSSGTYAAAADLGPNYYSDPAFVPQVSMTDVSNTLAAIASADYSAAARTTLGSNHAQAQASGFSNGALSVNSFSGWYDQITISGGTGTGTLQFSVNLTGSVTAGAYLGMAGFSLLASPVHPEQLAQDLLAFNMLTTAQPWGLYDSQVQSITSYNIVASPYNDPDVIAGLFSAPTGGDSGIPVITDPALPLGGEDGMGFPEVTIDLIVTPGAEHLVNVTLTGTLDFTYGETFYLIGALGTSIMNDGLESFCSFDISGDTCVPTPKDGTGATTLDFLSSALLAGIVLPENATFSSASGATYNVTAVPEPGEWMMLLAGLGLIAWRTRRKSA
ncbi:MAG: PEP-CTERM sorting domain-containing protein [Thiobacillus sp.]|nr:PEP-CTERM sorting domain-containing protein [Thiobacillus sp.]